MSCLHCSAVNLAAKQLEACMRLEFPCMCIAAILSHGRDNSKCDCFSNAQLQRQTFGCNYLCCCLDVYSWYRRSICTLAYPSDCCLFLSVESQSSTRSVMLLTEVNSSCLCLSVQCMCPVCCVLRMYGSDCQDGIVTLGGDTVTLRKLPVTQMHQHGNTEHHICTFEDHHCDLYAMQVQPQKARHQ